MERTRPPKATAPAPNDIPSLTVFLPEKKSQPASAIVICPGGGYEFLAFDHEGTNEAQWFQQRGVAAFVLKYRLPINGYRHPVPMLDAQRAIRLVRSHAADWNINPAKVRSHGLFPREVISPRPLIPISTPEIPQPPTGSTSSVAAPISPCSSILSSQ